METEWYQARACLRHLRKKHPDWTIKQLAQETGYCDNWVRKWLKRLATAPPEDATCLCSQSRARKSPPPGIAPEVVMSILAIRDDPPEGLHRTPGPVAIKYYLPRDETLQASDYHLPTSTSTIWRILDQNGRILRAQPRVHTPTTRTAPMQAWQIDFKDVTTVTGERDDKQLHLVETLDVVDSGTSILLDNPARPDFNAETALESLVAPLRQYGCPQKITFDRDTRFVGSWTADEFPSALMRFLLCLGIEPEVCPPRRPDLNAFVERYHKSYEEEAIQVYLPTTLEQVQDMNQDFRYHYNYQRPNQALTCGNQPPRRAFPDLPPLPPLPKLVDPSRWLDYLHGQTFKRRIDAAGTIRLGKDRYYISRERHKRTVLLQIDAPQRQLHVLVDGEVIKTMPLKGLTQQPLPFDDYVRLIQAEAVSQWRHYLHTARRYVRFVP
jgi:transposase InsO family protein